MVAAGLRITVVVPCYNVQEHLARVVEMIPEYVSDIVLVNDASADQTGVLIDRLANGRVHAVHLPTNGGVGAATLAGLVRAYELGADVIVKIDGDDQMDPADLPVLIEPLLLGKADYTKGDRFRSPHSVAQMPLVRRLGNAILSFLTKLASGYWNVFDPTNGYIAIRREILELLPMDLLHRRYVFETSILMALGLLGAVVMDVPTRVRYGTERSHLRIDRALIEFPWQLTTGFVRRMWLQKVAYSLTMEAILGCCGTVLIFGGGFFGIVEFIHYAVVQNVPAPAGTVMAAVLPIFLGFQMVMNAVLLDIQSVPRIPLCGRYVPPDRSGTESAAICSEGLAQ